MTVVPAIGGSMKCELAYPRCGDRSFAPTGERGDVVIVRFADDFFLVGFEHRSDAERFSADAAPGLLPLPATVAIFPLESTLRMWLLFWSAI